MNIKDEYKKEFVKLPRIQRDEQGCLEMTAEFCTEFLNFCHGYIKKLKCVADEIATRAKEKVTLVT